MFVVNSAGEMPAEFFCSVNSLTKHFYPSFQHLWHPAEGVQDYLAVIKNSFAKCF